eukprot:CAMPEP_0197726532 /NCGR_PEP_ID=MMETSP1434-20131217/16147_1 /TAXON_ID=265543 /ORGANISM="Minutocellus polymorphus, Strain CCMP3303" /LENGTH=303 /DNA_ID=CAMNT_0043312503 /DNA_START=147 /DNA_END=1058 /DNA_ORIENTATION=+
MTSRMMAQQQKAVRRQSRGQRHPDSSSPSSSNSSRSGSRTPKATNVHTNTNSDINFDQIWGDLVANHKIFPTEDQSSHHPSGADGFQTRLLEAQWQVGRSEFGEGRARATHGDYNEAINLFTQALAAQQKANLDENSPYIARTLVERGNAFAALGKLYDAVLDLEKALLIERRASGASEYESFDIADSYLRIGALQHRRGNFVEAVHCFECALAIRQRVLGGNDVCVIKLICVVAIAHHRRRDYPRALEFYSQGLALLAAVNRTNLSGAKERLEEFAWLRRCIADKNLYYNRVETYWQDDNVI